MLGTRAPEWSILVRLLVGLMGPFVGVVEIVCDALIIVGLLTRLAAIPSSRATASGACSTRRARISTCCWARSTW